MEGRFRGFTGFNLATRELPHAGKLRRGGATGNQQTAGGLQRVDDGGTHDVYQCSHRNSLGPDRTRGRTIQEPAGPRTAHMGVVT
ncbi:hypothetical protein StoSoilB3_15640 [Arthrobacter sp. StoSoilB3]|nr:hypothetical protein StoSoilB3_15640 [Arthrobacter sp. StoSoilB3]